MNEELLILDFDKVQKEWIEEAKGMTDLEKVKYYLKKIQENENREFIPYEQALELKELGFDEECIAYHHTTLSSSDVDLVLGKTHNRFYHLVGIPEDFNTLAPLYQQAFRWFDDNTDYIGFIVPSVEEFGFTYEIHNGFDVNVSEEEAYPFRHQAELACLKKLIEVVKAAKL